MPYIIPKYLKLVLYLHLQLPFPLVAKSSFSAVKNIVRKIYKLSETYLNRILMFTPYNYRVRYKMFSSSAPGTKILLYEK
jgi:hypothetical protein